MKRAPLLLPALGFIGAIAAESHGLLALACAAGIAASVIPRTRVAAAFVFGGLACALSYGHPQMLGTESRVARFAGTVVGDVRTGDDGASSFTDALDRGIVVRAHVRGDVVAGERVIVRGRLVPFDEARNPGEPSRRAIALGEGLAGELAGDRIIARGGIDAHDVRAWPARMRAALSSRLRAIVPEPEATVVAGALWGERGTLPHELRDDFQATGTVHVLVTAGLHLGVIAWLAAALLRALRVPRVPAALATILVVVTYAWLSGAHLPSQRAAVMVSVALLARACGARMVSWNALALAALIVAALWPASVGTVSFALSFSCVAAIGLFARPVEGALERVALPQKIREALALTVSTQIGVWPLSAATFGLIAPYAVLANALVVPATGVAMIAAISALVFAQVPLLGTIAARITILDVDLIVRAVNAVAALPGSRVSVAPPPASAIVAYDLAALLAARLLPSRPRRALTLLALASMGVLVTTLRPPDGRLTITMLDVGQGDGIVVRTPRGHTVLIDTGGRLERGPGAGGQSPAELNGERIVLGYLRRSGVRRIELLIASHPHGDHVGGCFPIVEALRVDAIGDSGQDYGGRAFRDCLAAARVRHVPVILVRKGMHYATGDGVTFDALAPEEPLLANGKNDVNENSVVLMMSYRCRGCSAPFRMLFTGDGGAATEARMLASGTDVRADVLKVGHHGSAYSSTPAFVAAVHAQVALISAGRHNVFGHPAPATLATLSAAGARIYRTDVCGAIIVEPNPKVRVTTAIRCSFER